MSSPTVYGTVLCTTCKCQTLTPISASVALSEDYGDGAGRVEFIRLDCDTPDGWLLYAESELYCPECKVEWMRG